MSTQQTQTNQNQALAPVKRLSTMLFSQPMIEKFSQALPPDRDINSYVSSIIATVSATPQLQRCTPESIALAAFDAATLGLPVNKLGLAWLVPYGNEAKFQIGYRGYIQLVMETGFVLEVTAEVVRANDKFKYTLGTRPTIEHEPALKNRGEVTHVYACAFLANGLVKHCVMTKEQVDHIRQKSKSANNGPWVTDYDEMAKKTVIKRMCKLLPYNVKGLDRVHRAVEIEERNEDRFRDYQPIQPQLVSVPQYEEVEGNEIIDVENITSPSEPALSSNNPLLSKVLDLQAELERLDSKAEKLPSDINQYSDGQLRMLANKKEQVIKEATKK